MAKKMTWAKAAEIVLAKSSKPLHYRKITNEIMKRKLMDTSGVTPEATLRVELHRDIENNKHSPFIRIEAGVYGLKETDMEPKRKIGIFASVGRSTSKNTLSKIPKVQGKGSSTPRSNNAPRKGSKKLQSEKQDGIVSSFGIFWKKDDVRWGSRQPQILGKCIRDKRNSHILPVNFWEQKGIYILYDYREIIYVGRTIQGKGGLGARLLDHTTGRMAERWDRFSWFGLRPVMSDGSLGDISDIKDTGIVISALEAVFIETLEPRLNRKRGDGLKDNVEYYQEPDPAIDDEKFVARLDEIKYQMQNKK